MRSLRIGIATICIGIGISAHAQAPTLSGRFAGTGRACFGSLSVHSKTITWSTPFSQCIRLPYETVEQNTSSHNTRFTFSFKRQPAGCRYRIITITHDGGRDDSTGWQVTGYGQEHSYLADKANGYTSDAPDIMSCYLIREPNKTLQSLRDY